MGYHLFSLFESAHTAFIWAWLYNITVTQFGSLLALNSIPWSLAASLLAFTATGSAVQAFFTYRIYVVSGQWWIAAPLWILEVFEVGTVASIVALTTKTSGFLQFKQEYTAVVYMTLISCAVVRTHHHGLISAHVEAFRSICPMRYFCAGT
jgi:hypothetical protein